MQQEVIGTDTLLSVPLPLIWILIAAFVYALGYSGAAVLTARLSKPWRESTTAHWSERARLAYMPSYALLWFAIGYPILAIFLASVAIQATTGQPATGRLASTVPWVFGFAGVLTARYQWMRELLAPRLTFRSWLAGCMILWLALSQHLLVPVLLIFLLPDQLNGHSIVIMGFALAAQAFGGLGGLLLLRWLRIVKKASPEVTRMVEDLARQMKVEGTIKVFELEWALLNALAWPIHRAVGFSKPLLAVMSPDELRAIAAHELAHLSEPSWVKFIRIVQMFLYLAVPPVIKYGGSMGPLLGWILFLAIFIGFRRFARGMEERADHLERAATADTAAYIRSMTKLYELNCIPAVMPGAQIHPHLYDRLLAAGIQPDFPKPLPPSRSRPLIAALLTGVALVCLLFFMFIAGAFVFGIVRAFDLSDHAPSRVEQEASPPTVEQETVVPYSPTPPDATNITTFQ